MKLFKIDEYTEVLICELSKKNDYLVISSEKEEVLEEERIFEVEEILIDPIKSMDNENYIEIVEQHLKSMGLSDCNYKHRIELSMYQQYYGFVTDIKNKKIMLVPYSDVDVM